MAWTTPRTWTTGELVTKTIMDTHVRDNLTWLGAAAHAIWAQPHSVTGTGAVLSTNVTGATDYAAAECVDAQTNDIFFSVPIPAGFVSLTKAVLVIISKGTGNLRWLADSIFAADGESYIANGGSIAAANIAVTANQVKELTLQAGTLLTGLAAGDRLGLDFSRQGAHVDDTVTASVFVLGLLLEYSIV